MFFKITNCIKIKLFLYKWDLMLLAWVSLLHYSLGYGVKAIYIIAVFCGVKFLFDFSLLAYRVFIVLFLTIGFLYSPIGVIYGCPDVNVIGSFLYTNSDESREFLINTPWYIYITSVMIVLLGMVLLRMPISIRIKSSRARYFTFVFFVVSSLWSPIRQGGYYDLPLPEVRFIKDAYASYQKVIIDKNSYAVIIKNKSIWKTTKKQGQYKTYILVIGESVRRDYVHAFGGKFSNTPWLDSAPATLFSNYISAGPATMISLTNTLSLRAGKKLELNNNIITLASSSGFETWWLSNQGKNGRFDSPVALIGSSADHSEFLKSGSSDDRLFSSDENLLPLLNNALKRNRNNKLIVLHLMGSHPKACIRTNNIYDVDVGSKEISCYIKSIAMTDSLLEKITILAKESGDDWSMMYFSDHGLSYVNKNAPSSYLTHGDKSKENYEVPFFIIGSNSERKEVVHKRRSAIDFMVTFSQWLRVSEPNIPTTCNMLSNQDCNNSSYVLDFKEEILKFDELPSIP